MQKFRSLAVYLLMAAFAAWCLIGFRSDIAKISLEPLAGASGAILLAGAASLFNYLLRILRWRNYLARLGHPLGFGFAGLSFTAGFAFTLSPGKVGEMARARYYTPLGIPLSSVAAAFFVERLLDLLAMLALAIGAFSAGSSRYAWLLYATLAVLAVMLALLMLLPWERLREAAAGIAWLPPKLSSALSGILKMLVAARALLSPAMLLGGFVAGLLAWGAEGCGLWLVAGIAPGLGLDLPAAVGVYSVAIIIGALSFLPGGLGSTEAVMVAMLAAHGAALPDAILITLVCRLLTLWLAVGLGWVAVAVLRYHPALAQDRR